MTIGTQEIIAIIIVAAVVGFAVYRRWRKKPAAADVCSNCENGPTNDTKKKSVHWFKKQ